MKAKIGAIFLVSVMAFAAIGAAYAHWEETLTIEGVMTTDNIDVGFYCADSNDQQALNLMDPTDCGAWVGKDWEGNRRDKNVGWMDVQESADKNTLTITIGDAYPCYYSHAFWCILNKGSCPVLIHSVKLVEVSIQDVTDPDNPGTNYEIPVDIDLETCTTYFIDYIERADGSYKVKIVKDDDANAHKYDYSIHPTGDNTINTQLDPWIWGEDETEADHMVGGADAYEGELEQDLCIHFENGCRQHFKYDFTIEICFYNWPELI